VTKLGIGIIGTGFIGQVHARAALLAGAHVVAAVASSPERSLLAGELLSAEKRLLTADELMRDPDIDVVHICTPNSLHVQLAQAAIAHGRHVVCEKPLATNVPDAERLAEAARAAGVVAAVPLAYRYHAMVREARSRVLAGDLGAVHVIHGSYLQDWCLPAGNRNWRMDAGLGGASRAIADIGTHWCDLVEWMSGQRITEVSATVETVIPKRPVVSRQTFVPGNGDADSDWETVDTEDAACMVFRASGDIIGTLTVSQVAPGRKNRIWIEFDGPQGSLVFDEDRPDRLWFGTIGGNQEILREPAALSPDAQRVSTLPAGHHEGFLDAFAAFLGDVYGAVDGGPALYPDFTDGLRSVRITEAVLRSSAERAWVEVGA